MNIQREFDKTVELLQNNKSNFPEVENLLYDSLNSEVTFHSFWEPSIGTAKEHLLDTYEIRARIEKNRKGTPQVTGYETLLPRFRNTLQEQICISDITTSKGSFIIFSDFERTELIGILVSKTTLQEVRSYRSVQSEKENIFLNGKLLS